MAADYTITSQKEAQERRPDGTYEPVIEIGYQTTTTPPVSGTVTVPKHLIRDKVAFVEAVVTAVEQAVASHNAVAQL